MGSKKLNSPDRPGRAKALVYRKRDNGQHCSRHPDFAMCSNSCSMYAIREAPSSPINPAANGSDPIHRESPASAPACSRRPKFVSYLQTIYQVEYPSPIQAHALHIHPCSRSPASLNYCSRAGMHVNFDKGEWIDPSRGTQKRASLTSSTCQRKSPRCSAELQTLAGDSALVTAGPR